MDQTSDDEATVSLDIFDEPADYYQPDKPATFVDYTLRNGQTLNLRLVGHSPLWVCYCRYARRDPSC
jgi:nicotinamide N-methyltransferase